MPCSTPWGSCRQPAGRVQLVDTGPDVRMNIDADGGAGNGFELALLTFRHGQSDGPHRGNRGR